MKRSLLQFIFIGMSFSLFSMQESNQLAEKKETKTTIRITNSADVELETLDNTKENREIFEQSEVLKDMFESFEDNTEDISIPLLIDKKQFGLLKPHLTEQKSETEAVENLKKHLPNKLSQLYKMADYLEIPSLFEKSCDLLSEKLDLSESLQELNKNSNYVPSFNLPQHLENKIIQNNKFDFKTTSIFFALKKFIKQPILVSSLVFSPDGKKLVAGCENGTLWVYDSATAREIGQFTYHTNRITHIVFSPNDRFLASASEDGTVCVYNAATLEKIIHIDDLNGAINTIAFSPDSKFLVSASSKILRVYECEAFQEKTKLNGTVNDLAFSPDGKVLACLFVNGTICLYDFDFGNLNKVVSFADKNSCINKIAFSPDGTFFAYASEKGKVTLYNIVTSEKIQFYDHKALISAISFSPDGKFFATGALDKTVCVYDCATLKKLNQLTDHKGWVMRLAFSPDSKFLVTASEDKTVCVYNCITFEKIKQFTDHNRAVRYVAFSPDGNFLASASLDKTICLYNMQLPINNLEQALLLKGIMKKSLDLNQPHLIKIFTSLDQEIQDQLNFYIDSL